MRIILGGRFETALVRSFDAAVYPQRNGTTHRYYVCLNRKLPKAYFDRTATFVALANETLVPSIDWGFSGSGEPGALSGLALGLVHTDWGGREWDDGADLLSRFLLRSGQLSPASTDNLRYLDLSQFDAEARAQIEEHLDACKEGISHHFLCRLFLQIRAAQEGGAFLVLAEDDLALLQDVVRVLEAQRVPLPFDLPQLRGQVLQGDDFAAGLLNFAPPDAESLMAIRRDKAVNRYAARVREAIAAAHAEEGQVALLRAMQESHRSAASAERVEDAFEVAGWVAKPLHYVPVLGEALSIVEDLKDVAGKWIERRREDKEWYLLAARMTDVAVRDYLARKGNLLRG
ncbi:hypothetical protein GXW74_13970 [Roseomonas eburnea]|uniref:Uncharacterized protein n=1 Tax=Neoroseomonas eburnea TaxID=1346889 RepID=A0A9X9XD13_9PROT|nr:hypothetical protein [Neoroseomonas eburnea]MBR0681599.1 hypothetical protein [Neoroseomonas eburnea]